MNNFLNTYPECFEHPDAVFQSAGCNQMYVVVHDFECYQMDFGSLARGFGQHPHGGVQLMFCAEYCLHPGPVCADVPVWS